MPISRKPCQSAIATTVDPRVRKLDWPVILAIGLLHLGCLAAPFTFSWTGLGLVGVLGWVTAGLGITLCYHRLLTHRSYHTRKIVEYFLTILGTLTWQGGPIHWVGTHRLHHKESDQPGDPHSPRHGFTWAHVLWCMYHDAAGFGALDAAKDLQRDRVMVLLDRFFYVPQFALVVALFAGGWAWGGYHLAFSWLVWGVCVRAVATYHVTWLTNSAAHTWGYRNFTTTDNSRNTWWLALMSAGEGWHNNHHAQQRSAAHGMRWFELDATYWVICLMGWVGLANHIVRPIRPARAPLRGRGRERRAAQEHAQQPGGIMVSRPSAMSRS